MPPTATFQTDMNVSSLTLAEIEHKKAALTSITRQHESAVFTYLYRRVRRSVNVESLTKEVFARLLAIDDLELTREALRPRLVVICQEVLSDFVSSAKPEDAAWTGLCLELDALAREKQAGQESRNQQQDLSS